MLTSVQRVKVMAGITVALRSECRIERQMAAQLTMRNSWNKRISCGRRLAGDGVSPITAELSSTSHRRQAASHNPLCVLVVSGPQRY
ncbi:MULTISPECIES: hypothetical protein [Pseudomonas syringae group]|uniref:hypothetical protein n=1 Tax=Pseudomonas syringae group TaxID=136849 RepID=UPI0013CEF4CD|nr:hypothetical protein [Pseudomonas viridiflava]MBD8569283.1 hypothetical protein [Pseudomonas syringae]MEE4099696.1 hypothetical protein [Pseudomonas viridiflava]